MADMQNIQWFPGHMAKTRRKIAENLKLVDAVVEIVDSRVPVSSRNPEIPNIIKDKPHMIVLNKCDLADSASTLRWCEYYQKAGIMALVTDSKTGYGIAAFKQSVKFLLKEKLKRYEEKGMANKKLRIMVVGIPNVGKSSLINKLCSTSRAKVEDRPGVTRANQWYTVDSQLELLDTPGVLWPKFEDPITGEHLAFCGAVKDEIMDRELLSMRLAEYLKDNYPKCLTDRFKLTDFPDDAYDLLCAIGRARGMVVRGGEIDTERAAVMLLDEFRGGKLGKITIEQPKEANQNAGLRI